MLKPSGFSSMLWRFDNWGTDPTTTPGTSITPGASGAEGSWTEVASSANVAQDVYCITLYVMNHNTGGVDRSLLVDIGVDPAGGTSYTEKIANIACASVVTYTAGSGPGVRFTFPLFVKAGSSIAIRGSAVGTALAFFACVTLRGQPSRPEQLAFGSFSETVGTITGNSGVAFTPGNAADGAWASLGTTAKAMWWWQLAYQCAGTTLSAQACFVELGYGPTGSQRTLIKLQHYNTSAETGGAGINENQDFGACFCPLPAGTELWVRGRNNIAPTGTFSAVAIGIGG